MKQSEFQQVLAELHAAQEQRNELLRLIKAFRKNWIGGTIGERHYAVSNETDTDAMNAILRAEGHIK